MPADAPPPRLPSRRLCLWVFFGVSAALTAASAGYVMLAARSPLLAPVRHQLLVYIAAAHVVTTLTNLVVVTWLVEPVRRLQRALDSGTPAAELDPADQVRALTAYRPVSFFVFAGWSLAALGWVPYHRIGNPDAVLSTAWLVALAGVCIGFLAAVMTFYAYYHLVAERIAPVVLASGSLDGLGGLSLVRVWHHLALLIFTFGLVQPLLAWVMAKTGSWGPLELIYIGVLLFTAGGVQAAGILYALSRPAGHLHQRMRQVRTGDLSVRARIRGADTLGQLCSDFNSMVEGLRQREQLRETFGRYVSRQVADEILAGRVELGGETRTATVLFSDIRGFTRMSERLEPEQVVVFLNEYLDLMVDAVHAHGGRLDKFIGDAILAVFGAPLSMGTEADDARAALACAMEMSRRLDGLNAGRTAAGQQPIEVGIGVHTGPLLAGNIGSREFTNYTVIGDTVNLTSRIEGLTKDLGSRILVSDAAAAHAPPDLELEALPPVSVRGREAPVRLYRPSTSSAVS